MSGGRREPYIIEFIPMANAVKVSAIDPVTSREVSIVGSNKATEEELTRLAVQKLEYVLRKKP